MMKSSVREATAGDLEAMKAEATYVENASTAIDHQLTAWQCIQRNPKVVFWAIYANGTYT